MGNPARTRARIKMSKRLEWKLRESPSSCTADTHRHTDTHGPADMNALTVVALLHCFLLAALVQSAPVSSPSSPSQLFREAVERALRMVEKIRKDVPSVHSSIINVEGFTLDASSQIEILQMMKIKLGIPDAPILKEVSRHFPAETCVRHMLAGGRLFQGLLGDLSRKLGGLEVLTADLRDLLTHIIQVTDAGQLSSDSSDPSRPNLSLNLHSNFEVQAAAQLTLSQLLEFCHDLIRSLRDLLEKHQPVARGTR